MRRTSFHIIQELAYCKDGSGRYHELFAKIMAFLESRLHTRKVKCDFLVVNYDGVRYEIPCFVKKSSFSESPLSPKYAAPS